MRTVEQVLHEKNQDHFLDALFPLTGIELLTGHRFNILEMQRKLMRQTILDITKYKSSRGDSSLSDEKTLQPQQFLSKVYDLFKSEPEKVIKGFAALGSGLALFASKFPKNKRETVVCIGSTLSFLSSMCDFSLTGNPDPQTVINTGNLVTHLHNQDPEQFKGSYEESQNLTRNLMAQLKAKLPPQVAKILESDINDQKNIKRLKEYIDTDFIQLLQDRIKEEEKKEEKAQKYEKAMEAVREIKAGVSICKLIVRHTNKDKEGTLEKHIEHYVEPVLNIVGAAVSLISSRGAGVFQFTNVVLHSFGFMYEGGVPLDSAAQLAKQIDDLGDDIFRRFDKVDHQLKEMMNRIILGERNISSLIEGLEKKIDFLMEEIRGGEVDKLYSELKENIDKLEYIPMIFDRKKVAVVFQEDFQEITEYFHKYATNHSRTKIFNGIGFSSVHVPRYSIVSRIKDVNYDINWYAGALGIFAFYVDKTLSVNLIDLPNFSEWMKGAILFSFALLSKKNYFSPKAAGQIDALLEDATKIVRTLRWIGDKEGGLNKSKVFYETLLEDISRLLPEQLELARHTVTPFRDSKDWERDEIQAKDFFTGFVMTDYTRLERTAERGDLVKKFNKLSKTVFFDETGIYTFSDLKAIYPGIYRVNQMHNPLKKLQEMGYLEISTGAAEGKPADLKKINQFQRIHLKILKGKLKDCTISGEKWTIFAKFGNGKNCIEVWGDEWRNLAQAHFNKTLYGKANTILEFMLFLLDEYTQDLHKQLYEKINLPLQELEYRALIFLTFSQINQLHHQESLVGYQLDMSRKGLFLEEKMKDELKKILATPTFERSYFDEHKGSSEVVNFKITTNLKCPQCKNFSDFVTSQMVQLAKRGVQNVMSATRELTEKDNIDSFARILKILAITKGKVAAEQKAEATPSVLDHWRKVGASHPSSAQYYEQIFKGWLSSIPFSFFMHLIISLFSLQSTYPTMKAKNFLNAILFSVICSSVGGASACLVKILSSRLFPEVFAKNKADMEITGISMLGILVFIYLEKYSNGRRELPIRWKPVFFRSIINTMVATIFNAPENRLS